MSPHQLIYDMYNTIALTEIKGYAMMQFSWMLLRIYGRGKLYRYITACMNKAEGVDNFTSYYISIPTNIIKS